MRTILDGDSRRLAPPRASRALPIWQGMIIAVIAFNLPHCTGPRYEVLPGARGDTVTLTRTSDGWTVSDASGRAYTATEVRVHAAYRQ